MSIHRALGRGLDVLIPTLTPTDTKSNQIVVLPIDQIQANKNQPRTVFDTEKIDELASSIKENGIVQPILVTPTDIPDKYEIIVGERRWRAAQRAGLTQIPVIIKPVTPNEKMFISLIENLQREDLSPLEEAAAYHRLIKEFNLTQEEVALRVGKGRSYIANTIRLLNLPEEIKIALSNKELTAGHARTLLGIENETEMILLARQIIANQLKVRETEDLVRKSKPSHRKKDNLKPPVKTEIKETENNLQRTFATKVKIKGNLRNGRISIYYYSFDDLERIVAMLLRKKNV